MSLPITMSLLTLAELGMALVLLVVFLRVKDLRQRFSVLVVYFLFRVGEGVFASLLPVWRYAIRHHFLSLTSHQIYVIYFYAYWLVFLISAFVIFCVLLQLYSLALSPLPGLKHLGRRVFYWAGGVSLLMAFTGGLAPSPLQTHPLLLTTLAMALMRCVSVLEICLLAILVLTVNKLGLGFKSRIFGFSSGLGILAVQCLVVSVLATKTTGLYSALNIGQEVAELLGLGICLLYAFRPEPARKPIMLPVTSPLIRWNEIALALGFGEAQVVIGGSPSSFQVPGLERAVGGVLGESTLKKSMGQIG